MQFMKNMLHLQTINRPLFTRQKDSGCYVPQMQHFNVLQYYLDPVSPFHCGYTLWVQMCCICSTLKCCKCRASRPIKCSHYTSLSFPLWLHFMGPDVLQMQHIEVLQMQNIQTHKVQPLYQSLLSIVAALYGSRCLVLQLQHFNVLQYYPNP